MKTLLLILISLFSFQSFGQTLQTFHSFKVKDIHGDSISLSTFAGKKLLVVNTASFCGYTYQFARLQKLDSLYRNQNFRVIGFPSNDFGGQDPYADSTIETFCLNQYAVTFPLMSKISIVSGDTAPVYKWLQRKALNGVANAPVEWNFNKFLIDGQGKWVRRFLSPVQPNDTAITNWIQLNATEVAGSLPGLSTFLFMNPSKEKIRIDNLENNGFPTHISLISLNGNRLKTWSFPYGLDEMEESVTGIAKGIYILQIQNGNRVERHKLIVNNE